MRGKQDGAEAHGEAGAEAQDPAKGGDNHLGVLWGMVVAAGPRERS